MLELFKAYDENGNGELDYKEFTKALFNDEEDEEVEQKESPKKKSNNEKAKHTDGHDHGDETDVKKMLLQDSKILEKFREKLYSRGGKGMVGLQRQFKIFDDNNSHTLELDELIKAVKDFRVDLSKNEIKILFQLFDINNKGYINYDEFLREIRGDMNAFRTKLVDRAFSKLDTDGSGAVEMEEIKQLYNCKKHPDVISGKKTEEEVYGEFIETFEIHASNKGKGVKDHTITREEFQEYYENISCSIDLDEYFELMIKNAWKLDQPSYTSNKAYKADYSKEVKKGDKDLTSKELSLKNKYKAQYEGKTVSESAPWGTTKDKVDYSTSNSKKVTTIGKGGSKEMLKFREILAGRGTRGIFSIRRSFMICDDDNSKSIDGPEFKKLCKDYRIPLSDTEVTALFKEFDIDRSGTIDFDEFVKGIVGDMNDFRKGFVKKAFVKLDKNGNGKIELDDIRGTYNATKHPDVKSGKKTEDEVLAEFLDTFEYHFNLLVN